MNISSCVWSSVPTLTRVTDHIQRTEQLKGEGRQYIRSLQSIFQRKVVFTSLQFDFILLAVKKLHDHMPSLVSVWYQPISTRWFHSARFGFGLTVAIAMKVGP